MQADGNAAGTGKTAAPPNFCLMGSPFDGSLGARTPKDVGQHVGLSLIRFLEISGASIGHTTAEWKAKIRIASRRPRAAIA
jgi:hypothetical protein